LRKINTPSNDTNTTAQKINIPRDDGGGRLGNWITLKITPFNAAVQQPRMNTNQHELTGQEDSAEEEAVKSQANSKVPNF
jgi:hypothetical protein